jgi:hypothetical protein
MVGYDAIPLADPRAAVADDRRRLPESRAGLPIGSTRERVSVRRRVIGEAVIREASARDCDEVAGRDVNRELKEDRILGGAVGARLVGGGVN